MRQIIVKATHLTSYWSLSFLLFLLQIEKRILPPHSLLSMTASVSRYSRFWSNRTCTVILQDSPGTIKHRLIAFFLYWLFAQWVSDMPTSWGLYLVFGQLLVMLLFWIAPRTFLLLMSAGGVLPKYAAWFVFSTDNTWLETKNEHTESKLHPVDVHFREIILKKNKQNKPWTKNKHVDKMAEQSCSCLVLN